jgi:hypothetical protein
MGAFLAKREVPMRRRIIAVLIAAGPCGWVLGIAGCHSGDAPTEPPAVRATPTPPASIQLAGTWTGRMGEATETFTARATQSGRTLTVDWTLPTLGAIRFVGGLDRTQLRGHLTVERDSTLCPIAHADLSGTASASHINLAGFALCHNFDVSRVSIELTR